MGICLPKSEGGLGLKDLFSWNQACVMQNLWAIFFQIWLIMDSLDSPLCAEGKELMGGFSFTMLQLGMEKAVEIKNLGT